MYLIRHEEKSGWLTWKKDDIVYIMAFTTGDKADEYNSSVLEHEQGVVMSIERKDSKDFARNMVMRGVSWMIVDFPVENDKWEWWDIQPELARNYSIVDLKQAVK